MKKSWIDNKTIIITGVSSGIGRELARRFIVKHNCFVIGVARNEQKVLDFIDSLGSKKSNFSYQLFDVSDHLKWREFASSLKTTNVDVIINNAGMLPSFSRFIPGTDEEELFRVMNVNFNSIVHSSNYIIPIIEKSTTPAIINISSSAGLCALPGTTMYSASKAAVKNFTEALRCEKNYYVGLVCPGFTKTDLFRNQKHSSENKLINMISTNLDKMADKIEKGICRKKKRMVFGFDAKCMDKLYRSFPVKSLSLFSSVLRKANIELFDDVFENNSKE